MVSSLKSKLIDALAAGNFAEVADMALADRRVFGKLIALAYNKDDVMCWRAIEALGVAAGAVARVDPARVRNLAQRLIWSAREESGGMGWSAPELLAEIASASPKQFADIPPIIVSLHSEDEENVFLAGVLRAIARMAEAGIRDVPGSADLVRESLGGSESLIRGLAAIAAEKAQIEGLGRQLRDLREDGGRFTSYENGSLVEKTVGEAAQAALAGGSA